MRDRNHSSSTPLAAALVAAIVPGMSACDGSASSDQGALTPVATISHSGAPSRVSESASGWFASSEPTTGASASAREGLPAGIDAASFAHTREGAETFTRTYLAARAKAYNTADSSWLRGWSAPSCRACGEAVEKVDLAKAHAWHVKSPVAIRADLTAAGGANQYLVTGTVEHDAISYVDEAGTTVHTQPATHEGVWFVVSWVDGRWVISTVNDFGSERR